MATTQNRIDSSGDRTSDEIREDIIETRRDMDETLDDLGERLHPRNIFNDLLDLMRSDGSQGSTAASAQRVAREIGRTVRNNPGPAMLMGAGAAWALMNAASDDGRRSDMKGRVQESGRHAKEKMADAADRASGKLKGLGGEAAEKTSEWREQASGSVERVQRQAHEKYAQASDRFETMVEESPLMVGAGFLAAGLLTGILLPRTRQEDRWMGQASDDLIERGKEAAGGVASTAAARAKEEGLDVGSLAEKAGRIAEKVKSSASESAREEGMAPGDLKKKAANVARSAKGEAKRQADPGAKRPGRQQAKPEAKSQLD